VDGGLTVALPVVLAVMGPKVNAFSLRRRKKAASPPCTRTQLQEGCFVAQLTGLNTREGWPEGCG
jgi:hypothetical protein